MDRSRAYSKRIEAGGIKVPDSTSCLLKDVPAPEKILAAEPLDAEDHGLVNIYYMQYNILLFKYLLIFIYVFIYR